MKKKLTRVWIAIEPKSCMCGVTIHIYKQEKEPLKNESFQRSGWLICTPNNLIKSYLDKGSFFNVYQDVELPKPGTCGQYDIEL